MIGSFARFSDVFAVGSLLRHFVRRAFQALHRSKRYRLAERSVMDATDGRNVPAPFVRRTADGRALGQSTELNMTLDNAVAGSPSDQLAMIDRQ
jgi:hypothetical protein